MSNLFLIQDGEKKDVTNLTTIAGKGGAELVFVCDPSEKVVRLNVRINRNGAIRDFSGGGLTRQLIGCLGDYVGGFRINVLSSTRDGDRRLAYEVSVEESPEEDVKKTDVPPAAPAEADVKREAVPPVAPAKAEVVYPSHDEPPVHSDDAAPLPPRRDKDAHKGKSKEIEDLKKERDEALRKAKELEDKMKICSECEAIKQDLEELQRKLNKLKNEKYEKEKIEIPEAEKELERVKKEEQDKLKEIEEVRTRVKAAEHTLEELKKKPEVLGMNDEELADIENKLNDINEREKIKTKLETHISELDDEIQALSGIEEKLVDITDLEKTGANLKAHTEELDEKIITLTALEGEKEQEWKEKLAGLSEILSEVLHTRLELQESYDLLKVSFEEETIHIESKARENLKKLEKCGEQLAEISNWVSDIKAKRAEEESLSGK